MTDHIPASAVDFTGAIRGHAEQRGASLTAEQVNMLDQLLKSAGRVQGNQVSFDLGEGRTGPLADVVDRELARMKQAPTTPTTASVPQQAGPAPDTVAALRAGRIAGEQAKAAAQAEEVARQGNPWSPGHINRTAQAVLTNHKPELAAQMKAEAGVRDAKYSWK